MATSAREENEMSFFTNNIQIKMSTQNDFCCKVAKNRVTYFAKNNTLLKNLSSTLVYKRRNFE